ncbi:MAG: cellulase family glycosylhydrolase, partial [Bdellovibrionia bacterium]
MNRVSRYFSFRFLGLLLVLFSINYLYYFNACYASQRALHTSGRYFKDQENRVILLRGVSAAGSSKFPPFQTIHEGDLNQLNPLGLNVIRLLFNWEAFEPQRGQYDLGYLAYYDRLIKDAAQLGAYVIVDLHQDAYSRFNIGGCGEGFPRWAVPELIVKAHLPKNNLECTLWGISVVFNSDLHKTWNLFYQDHNGVRTRFIELWAFLSQHFSTNENVIGYDILNEPWGDEKTQISPLYEDAAKVIRENDPDSILFLTPHVLRSTGRPTKLNRPSFDNFVYSAHYYDTAIEGFHIWFHNSPKKKLGKLQAKADEWGVPLFVAEFGGQSKVWGSHHYTEAFYNSLDQAFTGGAQ